MDNSSIFITGANGQLGQALAAKYPGARSADRSELDISSSESVSNYDWSGIKIIMNAAAYTDVDSAETHEGRVLAWQVNASAVANLVRSAQENDIVLVHISTEYVFDGTKEPHLENEPFSPLGIYGQAKAAGDIAVGVLLKRYIIRTSWVIGEGKNFVRTMIGLGLKGISPTVVADQFGRLTFTNELVNAIDHLLTTGAEFGTYNVSNNGDIVSWAEISRSIFSEAGLNLQVTDTTTSEYFGSKGNVAPRPLKSALDLAKLNSTGFVSTDWRTNLSNYVRKEVS